VFLEQFCAAHFKGYTSCIPAEFSGKGWKLDWRNRGLDTLLNKLRKAISTVTNRHGRGRSKCAHNEDSVAAVEELKGRPQTHLFRVQISRQTGLSQSSAMGIIQRDLGLKYLNRRHAQELSETNRRAFITPDLWPPNSRGLNPVEYKILA